MWVGPVHNMPPTAHAAKYAGENIAIFSFGAGITRLLPGNADEFDTTDDVVCGNP